MNCDGQVHLQNSLVRFLMTGQLLLQAAAVVAIVYQPIATPELRNVGNLGSWE